MGLSLQNQVSGFSKSFGLFKSGLLAVVIFQNFIGLKIGSCFWFKKFRVKFAQVSKISFKVLVNVSASKRFHLAKFVFVAKVIFCKVRFPKLASRFLAKVSAGLVWVS